MSNAHSTLSRPATPVRPRHSQYTPSRTRYVANRRPATRLFAPPVYIQDSADWPAPDRPDVGQARQPQSRGSRSTRCPRRQLDGLTCPQLAARLRASGTSTDRFLAALVLSHHDQVCCGLQRGAR